MRVVKIPDHILGMKALSVTHWDAIAGVPEQTTIMVDSGTPYTTSYELTVGGKVTRDQAAALWGRSPSLFKKA